MVKGMPPSIPHPAAKRNAKVMMAAFCLAASFPTRSGKLNPLVRFRERTVEVLPIHGTSANLALADSLFDDTRPVRQFDLPAAPA